VNESLVAAEGVNQDEVVNAMRVESTPQTKLIMVPWMKKLQPMQRDKEMGTEELEMDVALAGMHMAVAAGDLSGCWPSLYAP
jgi:hypothetical protein